MKEETVEQQPAVEQQLPEENKETTEEIKQNTTDKTPEEKLAELGYIIYKEDPLLDYGRLR